MLIINGFGLVVSVGFMTASVVDKKAGAAAFWGFCTGVNLMAILVTLAGGTA